MKIKKIRLTNGYKRFFDLTIDLGDDPKRIVVLVGPNGCGKSSVLDGMLFLHNAHRPIGDKGSRDYRYHSMTSKSDFNHNSVKIEFLDGDYPTVRYSMEQSGNSTTIFSFRSPYRYNKALNVTQSAATEEIRTNDYGASTTSDLDDKMEQNYRRLYVAYNRYMNDNDCKPSEAKTKIIGDLNRSIERCLSLKISSIGEIEASRGSLFFAKSDQSGEIDFNVLSSGEKEVIDLLLDLYLRRDDYKSTIFLFDEPELHISTAIQKNLLQEIDRLVGEDCQIWITTHSIGFLRAIQQEMRDKSQVIQFRSADDLGSVPCVLKPMQLTHANWRDVFSVALDDLVNLLSPERIIYCEGRDRPGVNGEEKGTDAKVYNCIFAQTRPETVFVSSGGNTELDQRSSIAIAIIGKVFPTLEIWVLKDRDMVSGKDATERDRQGYLKTNNENHRVLARREIENYLFDKEVLSAYCGANSFEFDESKYDGIVTDITNQDVKSFFTDIKRICGIGFNMNEEKFKIELAKYIDPVMGVFKDLENCIFLRK